MTREQRIERALREVVDFIRAHKLEQEPGLDWRYHHVKVGQSRVGVWEEALAGPISAPCPIDFDEFRFKVVHRSGCGRTAYYSRRKHKVGDLVRASDLRAVDGSPLSDGPRVLCTSCRGMLATSDFLQD